MREIMLSSEFQASLALASNTKMLKSTVKLSKSNFRKFFWFELDNFTDAFCEIFFCKCALKSWMLKEKSFSSFAWFALKKCVLCSNLELMCLGRMDMNFSKNLF